MNTEYIVEQTGTGAVVHLISIRPRSGAEWLGVYANYILAGGGMPEPGRRIIVYVEDFELEV